MQKIIIRSFFFPTDPHRPKLNDVDLEDDEWIINIETVPPNPVIGWGVRVWIGRLEC